MVLSVMNGPVNIEYSELIKALFREGNSTHELIVWDLRLPRVLAASLVGASLGMSGAMLQGMLKNSLASPFLLGISAGSGLVIILMLTLGVWQVWFPFGAWLGAIITTICVYMFACKDNSVSLERLILGGVAISSLFGAIQSILLLQAQDGKIQSALTWLIGSLNNRGWNDIAYVWPLVLLGLLTGCFLSKRINLLSLGDDLAMGLGTSVIRSRLLIGSCAALLAACAVSIAGLVGFIGLIVPHGVRFFVGDDNRSVLPLSAILGALVLTSADYIAKSGSVEIPVGVITALIGSPAFIILLYRRSSGTIS